MHKQISPDGKIVMTNKGPYGTKDSRTTASSKGDDRARYVQRVVGHSHHGHATDGYSHAYTGGQHAIGHSYYSDLHSHLSSAINIHNNIEEVEMLQRQYDLARTDMEDAKKLLSEGEAKAAKAEVDEVEKALAKLRDEREALFAKLRELDEKVSAQGVKMREAQVKYAAYAEAQRKYDDAEARMKRLKGRLDAAHALYAAAERYQESALEQASTVSHRERDWEHSVGGRVVPSLGYGSSHQAAPPQPYRAHTERVYTTAPHSFATTRPITAEYRAGGGSRTYSHAREAYRGPADEPLMYAR